MLFSEVVVKDYLSIVNDVNTIHENIVPGQLVSQWMLSEYNWRNYKIQYKLPIYINEEIHSKTKNDKIICYNLLNEIKIIIQNEQ